MMPEQKDTPINAPYQSGETPGMLKDPFGMKEKLADPKNLKMPAKKLIPGQTPGILKDPFNKHRSKGPKKNYTPPKGGMTAARKPAVHHTPTPPPEPFWYKASKYMFEEARINRNLSDGQIEWIKNLAQLMPDILVQVPPMNHVTTEHCEVAILLESVEHMQHIIRTKSADFTPDRRWNKTFVQLGWARRAIFWTELSKAVLKRLSIDPIE